MTDTTTNKSSSATIKHEGPSIRIIGAVSIVIAVLLAFFAFATAARVAAASSETQEDEATYVTCNNAINQLQEASDYLTTQTRMFIITGDRSHMDGYLDELLVANRRGKAVEQLRKTLDDQGASRELEGALAYSDELAQRELLAMRLACDHYGIKDIPEKIAAVKLSGSDKGLTPAQKIDAARRLVIDQEYDSMKTSIQQQVDASSAALLAKLNTNLQESSEKLQNLLSLLRVAVALLLCVVLILVLALILYVLKPLVSYINSIEGGHSLKPEGSHELHYLACAYNTMYEDNSQRIERLRDAAERDPLTSISNRGGYDKFLKTHTRNIALLLIDVDDFKGFNDAYGHDTGDAILKKIAHALTTAFRSTDFPCRIGGDEFAVIMTNMHPDLSNAVRNKIGLVNDMLSDNSDGLPLVTLSVGVAFSEEGMDDQDIYRAADSALYKVKENGRNGIAFYEK